MGAARREFGGGVGSKTAGSKCQLIRLFSSRDMEMEAKKGIGVSLQGT